MGKNAEIKKLVREGYAKAAERSCTCCGPSTSSCGGVDTAEGISRKIGYSDEELKAVPEGANLGLGCGNPTVLAAIKNGDTILALGSGAGFDCFLAAEKVGSAGRVIGVDMTPEMIDKSRKNAQKGNYGNVEFRLGEIERLPAADNEVDMIISNCVINLSPDKQRVFHEAFRVLKPGGRLMASDIVLLKELPDALRDSVSAYVGCISGALPKDDYLEKIRSAGFEEVTVIEERSPVPDDILKDPVIESVTQELHLSPDELKEHAAQLVRSISVSGIKRIPVRYTQY